MPSSQRSRLTGLLFSSIALATSIASLARAQTTTVETASAAPTHDNVQQLDKYVVSASRTPQDPKYTSSSVTVISPADLASAQINDLRTVLAQTPGVTVSSYGPLGSQSIVYIRGASSAQTLIVVDGIRVNSRQTDSSTGRSVMGSAEVSGFDRIEVLRGPQGTLYGSSALGGVIVMETTHGCGDFSGAIEAGGGSFDTRFGAIAVQGGTKNIGYSAVIGGSAASNERPENKYRDWHFATRIEDRVSEELLVGFTLRGNRGDYQEAGSLTYPSSGDVDSNNYLTTAYVEYLGKANFRSRLTFGWQQSDYTYTDSLGQVWNNSYARSTRNVVDWQNTVILSPLVTVVAGCTAEREYFKNLTLPDVLSDDTRGVYVSTDVRPLPSLSVTAGIRYDKFKSAGDATTARTGAAYWAASTGTKVRATLGTAFNAPGLTERFGDNNWYTPNPLLQPEKSTGWDVGFDQFILENKLIIGATYFQNQFRNMIVSKGSYPSYQWKNVNRARTEGFELAIEAHPVKVLRIRLSGTYLEAYDTTFSPPARVSYKPRKTGDLDVQWQATKLWLIGGGIRYVDSRIGYLTVLPKYTSSRLYTSYDVSKNFVLKVRVENAMNHYYEEIAGYPALTRGVFAGVEWKF